MHQPFFITSQNHFVVTELTVSSVQKQGTVTQNFFTWLNQVTDREFSLIENLKPVKECSVRIMEHSDLQQICVLCPSQALFLFIALKLGDSSLNKGSSPRAKQCATR